jgi:AcrR family transcriptional regulator
LVIVTKRTNLKNLAAAVEAALNQESTADDGKARTRARILRAATTLFQQQGYRRTSVDQVAQEAGVAKGTVYVHFKTKAELLFHAIREEKKRFIGPFLPLLTEDLEPAERLRRYLEQLIVAISDAPLTSRLMSGDREMLLFMEELPAELKAEVERTQATGMEALLSGVGSFDRLSGQERQKRAKVLYGLVLAAPALIEERARGGMSLTEYAAQLARVVVDGIGAP